MKIFQFYIISLSIVFSVFFVAQTQEFKAKFGGQYTIDGAISESMNSLNSKVGADSIGYIRSTVDLNSGIAWGKDDEPIIHFYDELRFRYSWGSEAETHIFDAPVSVAGAKVTFPGASANKHLVWMREGWLKFSLTGRGIVEKSKNCNFAQIGLIPFSVGRGVSLGDAYDSSGFLGFKSDFSIDQYAPAVLLHLSAVEDKYSLNLYGAILKNQQTSVEDNLESMKVNLLQQFLVCGIGKQSYIFACNNRLHHLFCKNIDIEPYIVYLSAPDQTVEFMGDANISLMTIGLAVEGLYPRWSWGFDAACNLGELFLKSWDRNEINYERDDYGKIIARYTKVYDQDAKLEAAMTAKATASNDTFLAASGKNCTMNGKPVGPNLYNSYDRFRSAQIKSFDGYFFVADGSFFIIPKVLDISVGAGYASGDFFKHQDSNKMSLGKCMNQKFSGFIPLQSIYAGKRIRHIVAFNQGLPRCANIDSKLIKETNLINDIQSKSIQDMTNIAFTGTRVVFRPSSMSKEELMLSLNIVAYFVPEPPLVNIGLKNERLARDFLGVELSTEFSWIMLSKLKCEGYAGVFLPGAFYRDNAGKILTDLKVASGSDAGFIANLAMTYEF